MLVPSAMNFADRLAAAIEKAGTFACVGLDPVVEKLPQELKAHAPVDAVLEFSRGVVDAVSGLVPIVKFQSACYERYGSVGVAALETAMAHARDRGLLVLLDAKRGDIGISAEHYAAAAFDQMGADAITISPYLGPDTIEPFMRPGKGVFVLVRTSNPGSDAVQSQRLAEGRTIGEAMGSMVATLGSRVLGEGGLSALGAVVGATKASDAAALRAIMPNQVFLVPGYGAQGGTADDIRTMLRPGQPIARAGVLVTASRSVIYPPQPPGKAVGWSESVRFACERLKMELTQIAT